MHGYNPYTHGCRCEVCRAAKAAYIRARRAEARGLAARSDALTTSGGVYMAPIQTHGYAGYQDYHCRCPVCREAAVAQKRERRSRMIADPSP